ncbi:MAG: LPXTG cell wall anchor domain-containing protein, partial [Salana multivorans]|nr:LPXTG cell wall anchor domain-containing protein [Salana multivorans]
GDSGVPPQLGITASTNVSRAEMSFPAPRRHDDGYGQWAGYDHSVSLPVTFTLAAPQKKATIDADIFIGICETICIPVQARLEVEPSANADNAADANVVKAALAALPAEAHPGFQAIPSDSDHETLVVEADVPGDTSAVDFFIAGADDYMFGAPVRGERDGKLVFSVPILDRPSTTPTDGGSSSPSPSASSGGPLGSTGAPVIGAVIAAVALLLGGAVLLLVRRRRGLTS